MSKIGCKLLLGGLESELPEYTVIDQFKAYEKLYNFIAASEQKEVQNILIKPDTLLTVKGFTKIIFKVSILEIAGKELSQDCLFLHFSLNLYLCENLAWPQYKEAVPGMIHQMATKLATDRDTDMDKQIRHHLPAKNLELQGCTEIVPSLPTKVID